MATLTQQRRDRAGLGFFRVLVAAIAIYAAVISRVPTSHCRCHDKKKPVQSSETQKKRCPFGELRLLAQAALLAPPLTVPEPIFSTVSERFEAPADAIIDSVSVVRARAPPAAVERLQERWKAWA